MDMARSALALDCRRFAAAELEVLDQLARLHAALRAAGFALRLEHVGPELGALIAFAGLDEVLSVRPVGQPPEREELLGVEEEGDLGDAPA